MRGIRRTHGAAPTQKAPATAERIAAMLTAIPAGTLQGKRDRALLLGFAGTFRRAELVALELEDLAFEAEDNNPAQQGRPRGEGTGDRHPARH
jgi:site-specific recombinase XerD